jgi:dephospho-CoA kinase
MKINSLGQNNKITIGLVGEIGSGKTTVANYLKERYQAVLFSFSGMLRDVLKRLYLEESRSNMQILSTILRQNFSQDLMSKVIMRDVKQAKASLVVTEAIRRPSDTAYLKQLPRFYVMAIQTDAKTRYQRLRNRSENPDDQTKTWEEFKKDAIAESEQKIREIAQQADFTIDNSGTMEELYKQVNKIVKLLNC